jgi:hypothetical protein
MKRVRVQGQRLKRTRARAAWIASRGIPTSLSTTLVCWGLTGHHPRKIDQDLRGAGLTTVPFLCTEADTAPICPGRAG